jgi:uncharacterized membrane protein
MTTPARIAKHPIHPVLVVFPIGLWVFSFVCDLVYAVNGHESWNDAAFYSIAGGIVGGLAAAIPGFVDLFSLDRPIVKRLGITHMLLNVCAVALFSTNLFLRTQMGAGSVAPVLLSVIGLVLISISGWLGGQMVYVYGVAVEPQPVAPSEEPGARRAA